MITCIRLVRCYNCVIFNLINTYILELSILFFPFICNKKNVETLQEEKVMNSTKTLELPK